MIKLVIALTIVTLSINTYALTAELIVKDATGKITTKQLTPDTKELYVIETKLKHSICVLRFEKQNKADVLEISCVGKNPKFPIELVYEASTVAVCGQPFPASLKVMEQLVKGFPSATISVECKI